MSLMALHESEVSACSDLGLSGSDFDTLMKLQETTVHDLGEITAHADDGSLTGHAFLGLSGPDWQMAKGGSMATVMSLEQARALAEERPQEMYIKNNALGLVDPDGQPIRGGKLIVATDHHPLLTPRAYSAFYALLAQRMHEENLIGYGKYSTAGDKNTNFPWLMDSFIHGYKVVSNDPLFQAAATGTSETERGLPVRGESTGWGVYNTVAFAKQRWGGKHPNSVAIQGAGAVGLWTAYFASQDEGLRVDAISDMGGMLRVKNRVNGSASMQFERPFVEYLLAHPELDKVTEIKSYIEAKNPDLELEVVTLDEDPDAILKAKVDWFVPAAAVEGEVIREDNVKELGARLGVVEGGNGTTDAYSHQWLVDHEKRVLPGEATNSDGVSCSMKQIRSVVRAILHNEMAPSDEKVRQELKTERFNLLGRIVDFGDHLGTMDYRRIVNDIAIGRMAMTHGFAINPELKKYMLAQAA
jgi:glutamate dehydrogenase/leucine dehydrogenase